MSELPKCRLCQRSPIKLTEGQGEIWFHPAGESMRDMTCPLDTDHFTRDEWTALMGGGEPVAEASRRAPGGINWLCDVLPDSGTKLYAGPAPAVDDAVQRDAARYRWLRDNNHLGAWFSAGNSHMSYADNIDTDIDDAMKEAE